jgi:hypothetical protein
MKIVRTSALLGLGIASLALTVAACGGGGTGANMNPATNANAGGGAMVAGVATLTIPNAFTASTSVRRAQFVSPSAQSLSITIDGAAPIYANVSASSSLCTAGSGGRTCTIPVSAPVGTDAVSLSLFDGPSGTGNLLGGGSGTQVVVFGTPFTIVAQLSAAVASAANAVVSFATGTAFSPGTAGTATVTITFADADGNTIPANTQFLTPLTLTSSDANVSVTPLSYSGSGSQIQLAYNGSTSVADTVTITVALGTKPLLTVPLTLGSATTTSVGCSSVLTTGASEATLGNYTIIYQSGTFSGTFTPTTGNWAAYTFAAATPTPAPTATPAPTPTPVPTATPTPVTYQFWSGTYSIPAYTAMDIVTSTLTSVNATSGCMYLATESGSTSTEVFGFPSFNVAQSVMEINGGAINSFSFSPALTASNGPFSATFTLSNGVTGTGTITAFTSFTFADARQAQTMLHLRSR